PISSASSSFGAPTDGVVSCITESLRGPPGVREPVSCFDVLPQRATAGANGGRSGRNDQATFLSRPRTCATLEPISDGVGAMVTPQPCRISTFSAADSPNAETIAPA